MIYRKCIQVIITRNRKINNHKALPDTLDDLSIHLFIDTTQQVNLENEKILIYLNDE